MNKTQKQATNIYDSNKKLFLKTSNKAVGNMEYANLFLHLKDYKRAFECIQISIKKILRARSIDKNDRKKLVLYFWKQSYAYFQLFLESKDQVEAMKLYRKSLCSSFRSICLSNYITQKVRWSYIGRLPSDFLKPTIFDFDLTKLNLKSKNYLETLCRAGHFLYLDGKRSISLKYFAKALLVQREINPQDHIKISQILNQSAMIELLENNHEVALKLIKESVKSTSYLSDHDFDTVSHCYYILGYILYSMSKINSANPEATYQNSLIFFEYSLKILDLCPVDRENDMEKKKKGIKTKIIEVKSKIPSYLSDFLLQVVTTFWPQ